MREFFFVPVFISLLALSAGCSPGDDGSQKSRTLKIPYPTADVQSASTNSSPSLDVEQEVENCSDNPKCHLEEMNTPFTNTATTYRINSVIYSDTDIMSGVNVQTAPIVNFEVKGIDTSSITSTTIRYNKKDGMGNIIAQTTETAISGTEGRYSVPIHSSLFGSSILISAPYEKHTMQIKILTNQGYNYNFEIEFFISSSTINPVVIERDAQIMNSHYYKMDEDLQSFLIDSISLENTLPLSISVSGDISVNNSTVAVLKQTSRSQQKTFISSTSGYPFDIYNWFTVPGYSYGSATAIATYTVKIERNGVEEELAVSSNYNGAESILSYNDLELDGNQKIKMNIYANLVVNNSVVGDHGQQSFFEGNSLCATLTINSSCACFFTPLNINNSSLTGDLFYHSARTTIYTIQELYYPNCGSGVPNGVLTQQLSIVDHPASSISLSGRIHRSDLKYTATTWLKGYEAQDDLGTISMTMDTLEAVKGDSNLGMVDPSLSYQGYIPGQL